MEPFEALEIWEEEEGTDLPSPKDLMFQAGRRLTESALTDIQEELVIACATKMTKPGRKPRDDLVRGISAIIPSILANLIVLHHDRPAGSRLVMPMSHLKRTRYDLDGFRKLPEVVEILVELGLLAKRDAVFQRRRTTIRAKGRLLKAILGPDIDLSAVTRVEREELIILTERPPQLWINGRRQPKTLGDYADTDQTMRLRTEMEELNNFLSLHDITLEGSPQATFRLVRQFTVRKPTDQRRFDLHGRLYGGFWMNLKATERHRLRIDGEPIADLDFSNMFPRLAYLHIGEEPPEGDLYAVPGLEDCREGAKAGLSALLSYPHEMRGLPPRLKEQLPKGWTARKLKAAMALRHPLLVPCFEKDLGLHLMFTESQILMRAMMSLMRQGVPALPMHDGMMVPLSKVNAAARNMEDASRMETGATLAIARKYVTR